HRDLKPANILLSRVEMSSSAASSSRSASKAGGSRADDRRSSDTFRSCIHEGRTLNVNPKITDFGLAKRVNDESSSTQTQAGTVLGTPSFMTPEQAAGKNQEIGPAADIYSLGAILYDLIVGRPPFKAGKPIDTIRQVLEQEP